MGVARVKGVERWDSPLPLGLFFPELRDKRPQTTSPPTHRRSSKKGW